MPVRRDYQKALASSSYDRFSLSLCVILIDIDKYANKGDHPMFSWPDFWQALGSSQLAELTALAALSLSLLQQSNPIKKF